MDAQTLNNLPVLGIAGQPEWHAPVEWMDSRIPVERVTVCATTLFAAAFWVVVILEPNTAVVAHACCALGVATAGYLVIWEEYTGRRLAGTATGPWITWNNRIRI